MGSSISSAGAIILAVKKGGYQSLPEEAFDSSAGAILALKKGYQDLWFKFLPEEAFDARKMFLKDRYVWSYGRIPAHCTVNGQLLTMMLTYPDWHKYNHTFFVNCLDLCIDNPEGKQVFELIESIYIKVGGHRECLRRKEHFEVACALFGRKVTHTNGKTMVPLALAPLHPNNLLMPNMSTDNICIGIRFRTEVHPTTALYGNVYCVERKKLVEPYEFCFVTTACGSSEPVKKGSNRIRVHSGVRHLTYMLFFGGFDKSKVTNIRLELDGVLFYNGPLQPLEHTKGRLGYGSCEAAMIFFSEEPFDRRPLSTVNCAPIDCVTIIIDTDQEEETETYAGSVYSQSCVYGNGMITERFI